MSGKMKYFENMINSKILQIHTAFIGQVVSVESDLTKATVQPLNLIQTAEGETIRQSVVTAPVINSARYKLSEVVPEKLEKLKSGDLVLCVCTDRDNSEAIKGKNTVPVLGHHELNDALVIGVL